MDTIPYFENIFPAHLPRQLNDYGHDVTDGFKNTQAIFYLARAYWGNDWTTVQEEIEQATGTAYFYNPQYGAFSAWGRLGNSNYHGMTISMRQRFKDKLSWDFNYTWTHSLDYASGLQSDVAFGGGFIINPIRQRDNYASSDFDMRHMINVNAVWQLPFGRGQMIGSRFPLWADAIFRGWQLSGIYRWNTGLPQDAPYDDARWATNWSVQSWVTRTRDIKPCITKRDAANAPKRFGYNTTEAYQSFRNAHPGETGERGIFRLPNFVNLDLGLTKAFRMPWEGHKLHLNWEVFNATNTQRFGVMDTSRTGWGMRLDPAVRNLTPPSNWSNFTDIQGNPRVMQFGVRYEFQRTRAPAECGTGRMRAPGKPGALSIWVRSTYSRHALVCIYERLTRLRCLHPPRRAGLRLLLLRTGGRGSPALWRHRGRGERHTRAKCVSLRRYSLYRRGPPAWTAEHSQQRPVPLF